MLISKKILFIILFLLLSCDEELNFNNPADYLCDDGTIALSESDCPDPLITVISPDENDTWNIGYTYSIIWTAEDLTLDYATGESYVDIELWNCNVFIMDVAENVINNGSYSWTIPAEAMVSDFEWCYEIRIEDSNNSDAYALSNLVFSSLNSIWLSVVLLFLDVPNAKNNHPLITKSYPDSWFEKHLQALLEDLSPHPPFDLVSRTQSYGRCREKQAINLVRAWAGV